MFERFTDHARRIVVLSQEEARALDHNYIGTEHILLGLLREGGGVASKVLTSLGISLEAARREVTNIVGRGRAQQPRPAGHIPFTPKAKKVLELSLRESLQLGHHYIGTEHILLGVIREGDGVGAQVLVALGADLDQARRQVIQLAKAQADPAGTEAGPRLEPPWASRLHARTGDIAEGLMSIAEALTSVNDRLTAVEDRLAAIERHLGIETGEAKGAPSGAPEGHRDAAVAHGDDLSDAAEPPPADEPPKDETPRAEKPPPTDQ